MRTIRAIAILASLPGAALANGQGALTEPQVQFMPREVYAGIEEVTTRAALPAVAASDTLEISQWLSQNRVEPTGPTFVRIRDLTDGRVQALVGIPIAEDVLQNKRIRDGAFQEGFFAASLYTGDPASLAAAERSLIEWALGREARPRQKRPAAIEFIVQGDPAKPEAVSLLVRL